MKSLFAISSLLAANYLIAGFQTDYGTFHDSERKRDVPYKVYYPEELDGMHPVVLFSHGLGGSVEGGAYLGQLLAENGYITFHLQHIGTDQSIWEGKRRNEIMESMRAATRQPGAARDRYNDIPFVVDQLVEINEKDNLFGRHLNLDALGMMGHSYGGRSTLAASGERMGLLYTSYNEPRIKSGLVLSPNRPDNRRWDADRAYQDIDIPLFHMTGTRDGDPLNRSDNFDPEQRTTPYREIDGPPQYLLVLQNADHATFGGRRLGKSQEKEHDQRHVDAISAGALHFFNAYLRDDREALEYLKNDYPESLDSGDRFEHKDLP